MNKTKKAVMANEKIEIEKSSSGLRVQIIGMGAFVAFMIVLVGLIFAFAFTTRTGLGVLVTIVLSLSFGVFWLVWSEMLKYNFKNTKYIIAQDSLIVQKPKLLVASEKHYRYDTILSAEVRRQSLVDGDNGQIILKVLHGQNSIVLNNVVEPSRYVSLIKQRVVRARNTLSLSSASGSDNTEAW